MNKAKYEAKIKLYSHELPAKINAHTGEVTPMALSKPYNIPEGKEIFLPEAMFQKNYNKSWEYLDTVLTPLEFKVVAKLCRMAKMNTNSLEPLNDKTAISVIAKEFKIGRNKVTPLFEKLLHLGVYGKFEIHKQDAPYTKYWILNPYLAFSGKIISSDIAKLFIGTTIEIEYNKSVKDI